MASVWKFPLEMAEIQAVTMPAGAKLLHVAMQHGTLTLWALVDPDASTEVRMIGIAGTGQLAPSESEGSYVGTVLDGPWVWHVFAEPRRAE